MCSLIFGVISNLSCGLIEIAYGFCRTTQIRNTRAPIIQKRTLGSWAHLQSFISLWPFASNDASLARPIFASIAEDGWPLYQLQLPDLAFIVRRVLIGVRVYRLAGKLDRASGGLLSVR